MMHTYYIRSVPLQFNISRLTLQPSLGSKLLTYHGLSALNTTKFPTWDSFFSALLAEDDDVLYVSTPKDAGQRAYSEFEIDIEPARLCARILSVREQIAREMTGDLKAIAKMGQYIFSSYMQNSKDRKDAPKQAKEKSLPSDFSNDDKDLSASEKDEDSSTLFGFDSPSAIYTNFDSLDEEALAPSPLRKGNFDLLYNLITQSAVIELLNSEDGVIVADEGDFEVQNKASQIYLKNFYNERLLTHFVGSQWHGKGDDFIKQLLFGSPIMMPRDKGMSQSDGTDNAAESQTFNALPLVIEPMRIAEQVLIKRDKLASEWLKIMEAVPMDHTEIRRLQLERLTGVPKIEPSKIVDNEFQ